MKSTTDSTQSKSFDWELALKQLNQNSELTKNLLVVFCEELPAELEKIQLAFQTQDWFTLRSIVHKLQGACVYCGVPRLRQYLQATEKILLLNEFDSNDLKSSIATVEQEATTVMKEIKHFLMN